MRPVSVVSAGLLMAAALCTGAVALKRVGRQLEATRICDAASAGDWQVALEGGAGVAGTDPEGRIAAECLCWAWAGSDQLDQCTGLMDELLSRPGAADWIPDRTLSRLVIRARIEQGRFEAAAELATRMALALPGDASLLELELVSRSATGDELAVLSDLRSRLGPDLEASLPLRLVLAAGHERRGEYGEVLEVLGGQPPSAQSPHLGDWYEALATALGALQRAKDLRSLYAQWQRAGGDPVELRARYAIRISMFGLSDPELSRVELLRRSVLEEDRLHDKGLHKTVYERLMGQLLADGRTEEALAVFDRARERFANILISRDEILRTVRAMRGGGAGTDGSAPGAAVGRMDVTFHLPADAPAGGSLHVADASLAADHPYPVTALEPGRSVTLSRRPGSYPHRWVYRDARGDTRASGSTWADRADTQIHIEVRPADARLADAARAGGGLAGRPREAGDGRRRVFLLIPDCGDWRLIQYLRERGELPLFDHLLASGWSGIMTSRPAFTGAAMESLVWPERGGRVTFAGQLNRLGLEIAGLASVGRNPAGFLSPWLPQGETLFERVGRGDRVAQNLLFSHGQIRAGRHAERIGPQGRRRRARDLRALRPLSPAESADLPVGLRTPRYRAEVEKLAAELDAAVDLAREGEVDLLLLRLEPLDILTHGFFTELMRPLQDDGDATLFWAYRYIDRRLAEVYAALDADDVMIVMSDHGIRTALEHDEDSFFVAVGSGVPRGRMEGRPHLSGVPRLISDLLDLGAAWPDTGIAPWARGSQRASSRPPAGSDRPGGPTPPAVPAAPAAP